VAERTHEPGAPPSSGPAFYARRGGRLADWWTLLHPPYTVWHLGYAAMGAALAPSRDWTAVLATLAAFLLAVGIAAHALDELNGRPLRTRIPRGVLIFLAVASIAGAVAIGIAGAVRVNPWIAAFVVAGAFIVVAYNLESFGGRFHDNAWFALAWGSFPLLTGYFATAESIGAAALAGAVFAFALSLAQRVLSTQVRDVRRRVTRVRGTIERADGTSEELTGERLMGPAEEALRILSLAVVALACASVMMRAW